MRPRIVVIGLVVAIAWVLIVASQFPLRHSRPATAPAADHPLVTWAEFNQITRGMTYEDCVHIIGAPGDAYGSSDAPSDHHASPEWVSYLWRNSPDSYAQISFHRGQAERLVATNLP